MYSDSSGIINRHAFTGTAGRGIYEVGGPMCDTCHSSSMGAIAMATPTNVAGQ